MRPLTAEIGWRVWGTPANFNGFRILASLLQRRQSPEANQTLHDVCPSPGLVDKIYTFGGSCPLTEFYRCKIHFTSKSCVLLLWLRYCTALQQWASAKLCGVVQGMELHNFRRRRHLYSVGRPSRWASAHILGGYCLSLAARPSFNVVHLVNSKVLVFLCDYRRAFVEN